MFARMWRYSVQPAQREEFEAAYRADGEWAQLFASTPGYLGTDLLHDVVDPSAYVTIDRWESSQDWEAFLARHSVEYYALDSRLEELTVDDVEIIAGETS
jgi:heme-degrading monooxygenase HmoA